jgi:succinate dehydrogenase / fumarate reductase cytochrome b subunit
LASPTPRARPLSPHLSIWKPGPHMVVSILHRITGDGMATVGTVVLVWWLAAIAAGRESYATFHFVFAEWMSGALGYLFAVGMTLCLFQHIATGVRHFFLDAGAGYELKVNRAGSIATMVFSVVATVLVWVYIVGFK